MFQLWESKNEGRVEEGEEMKNVLHAARDQTRHVVLHKVKQISVCSTQTNQVLISHMLWHCGLWILVSATGEGGILQPMFDEYEEKQPFMV